MIEIGGGPRDGAPTDGPQDEQGERAVAERLLRGYDPGGPLAPGRRVDPDEPILPATAQVVLRERTKADGLLLQVQETQVTFPDGAVYAWEWHGPVCCASGTRMWCTAPELLWAREASQRLVRGAFADGRAPLVDASVLVTPDPTAGTGLTREEARFIARREAGRLMRRRPWLLAATLGLAWSPLRDRLADLSSCEGPLEPVEVVASPFGVSVTAGDGLVYAWQTVGFGLGPARVGDRVWATPVATGRRVALIGAGAGRAPYLLLPRGPASLRER